MGRQFKTKSKSDGRKIEFSIIITFLKKKFKEEVRSRKHKGSKKKEVKTPKDRNKNLIKEFSQLRISMNSRSVILVNFETRAPTTRLSRR